MKMNEDTGPRGFLIILSSPSGGGKTSIFREILKRNPEIRYSVSTTTRKMRRHEVDGKDYRFLAEKEFRRKIEEGYFAEWAEVHGNLYGTSRAYIDRTLEDGNCVIMDIDIRGGKNLKRLYSTDSILIFVLPPTIEELGKRLRARETDSEETIQLRLHNAQEEIKHVDEYDYLVFNRKLEQAVKEVECIICAERRRIRRVIDDLHSFNKSMETTYRRTT